MSCCISLSSGAFPWNFSISFFALSRMYSLLELLTSSMLLISNFASHGPTLSIVSIAAAMIVVSDLSIDVGISTVPVVLDSLTVIFASILPIFPFFCSSRSSSSSPNSPSVWPKIAPMTSGFSTTPSAVKFA